MAYKGGTLKKGTDKYYPNAYYKVGDLFLTTNSENPSVRFGGTWELYGKGKTLVCVDSSDTDFNEAKKTGGSKETHLQYITSGYGLQINSTAFSDRAVVGKPGLSQEVFDKGNLQPYITCYIWIRVE